MERILEQWVTDELKLKGLSQLFVIELVHRALTPMPPPEAPPRAIIACRLPYRDRAKILKASREMTMLQFEGRNIVVYPNYTEHLDMVNTISRVPQVGELIAQELDADLTLEEV
ncbi:hypothetical protein NDU88_005887 [Pleurodeles waltl]|uniref:Uncharacterized protein n=1 Tax=Pleurodeles waltl TaxID=8319 RepID=A0AAV7WBU3_PLEWA|nr:hypothetical protein NDU88_005887 [Pleurodeles waltl]